MKVWSNSNYQRLNISTGLKLVCFECVENLMHVHQLSCFNALILPTDHFRLYYFATILRNPLTFFLVIILRRACSFRSHNNSLHYQYHHHHIYIGPPPCVKMPPPHNRQRTHTDTMLYVYRFLISNCFDNFRHEIWDNCLEWKKMKS